MGNRRKRFDDRVWEVNKNRFPDSTWGLYQSIKALLVGYLSATPDGCCARKQSISKGDGAPELNPAGTAKRRPPWRAFHDIAFCLTALGYACVLCSALGGFGGDRLARGGLAVRARMRELIINYQNATFGELSPYEYRRIRREYP